MSMPMIILLSLGRRLPLLTQATNMKSAQLDQLRHLPQQANMILEILRLPKLLMRLDAGPSDERNEHAARLVLVALYGHIVLDAPAVADAPPVWRGFECAAGELLETTCGGCTSGDVVVWWEEGEENLGDG